MMVCLQQALKTMDYFFMMLNISFDLPLLCFIQFPGEKPLAAYTSVLHTITLCYTLVTSYFAIPCIDIVR